MSAILDTAARLDPKRAQDLDANDRRRKAWMFIGATHQRGSPYCEECTYCEHRSELTTAWDGSAPEHWTECALGRLPGDVPESCGAYAAKVEMEEAE